MVGLQLLKHTCNVSDEEVVATWVENPYWQYFCDEQYFSHEPPIDPSLIDLPPIPVPINLPEVQGLQSYLMVS